MACFCAVYLCLHRIHFHMEKAVILALVLASLVKPGLTFPSIYILCTHAICKINVTDCSVN